MGTYSVYKKLNDSNELFLQEAFETLESAQSFVSENYSDIIEYTANGCSVVVYGNNPSYTIPPVQAVKISKMQAVIALIVSGKLQLVEAAIQAKGGLYWMAWQYADSIEITSQMLLEVWASLGYSHEELQQLFNFAYSVRP